MCGKTFNYKGCKGFVRGRKPPNGWLYRASVPAFVEEHLDDHHNDRKSKENGDDGQNRFEGGVESLTRGSLGDDGDGDGLNDNDGNNNRHDVSSEIICIHTK